MQVLVVALKTEAASFYVMQLLVSDSSIIIPSLIDST